MCCPYSSYLLLSCAADLLGTLLIRVFRSVATPNSYQLLDRAAKCFVLVASGAKACGAIGSLACMWCISAESLQSMQMLAMQTC